MDQSFSDLGRIGLVLGEHSLFHPPRKGERGNEEVLANHLEGIRLFSASLRVMAVMENEWINSDLSAPGVVIFLRSRLRFFDAGKKHRSDFWAPKVPFPPENLAIFLAMEKR